MHRRSVLSGAFTLALGACSPKGAEHVEPIATPLDVSEPELLHALAGLRSLLIMEPQRILESSVHEAVMRVVSAERFEAFAASHGGFDLRAARTLTIASFDDATQFVTALGSFSPADLERWFRERVDIEGRAIDRGRIRPFEPLTRTWGGSRRGREQLGMVQSRFAMWEAGRLGPLRVAHLFAQGALKKVKPAATLEPLATLRKFAGDAPLRWYALGPFEGAQASAVAGLLGACTGLTLAIVPLPGLPARIEIRCAMLGTFGEHARSRFVASFDVIANDALGRLCGLHERLSDLRVQTWEDRIEASLILESLRTAEGLRAATDGTVADVMKW